MGTAVSTRTQGLGGAFVGRGWDGFLVCATSLCKSNETGGDSTLARERERERETLPTNLLSARAATCSPRYVYENFGADTAEGYGYSSEAQPMYSWGALAGFVGMQANGFYQPL